MMLSVAHRAKEMALIGRRQRLLLASALRDWQQQARFQEIVDFQRFQYLMYQFVHRVRNLIIIHYVTRFT